MKFPEAKKYTSGSIIELTKGKKYKLTLRYKDEKNNWVSKPNKVVYCKGKKEAEKLLNQFQQEQEKMLKTLPIGTSTTKNLTVEEAVIDYINYQKDVLHELEESTYAMQFSIIKKHVTPHIGTIVFTDLNVDIINNWWAILSTNLSQGYIHYVFAQVAKVYAYYYKTEKINSNPFEHLPKKPKKASSKVTHLEVEQIEEFYSALNDEYEQGNEFWTAFNIAFLSGLRRGEICALRWLDINLETKSITVSSAIGKGLNGTYTKEPKNKTSHRTFRMPEQLYDVLNTRYNYLLTQKEEVNKSWYVCGHGCGVDYASPDAISSEFRKLSRKYNLKDAQGNYVTLHGLRHNFATQAAASNVDIKSLQKMLGHANAAMTLNTYANDSADAMLLASEKLSDANAEITPYLYYTGYDNNNAPTKVEIENAIDVLKRAGYNVEKLSKGIAK